MRYYINAFRNYAKTDGRASRKEIWMFTIFHLLVLFVLSFFEGLFGQYFTTRLNSYGLLQLSYMAISACPSICLRIRRLHDVDKSGKWWGLEFLPIVSLYVLYLYYIKTGDAGRNDYGNPPGEENIEETIVQNKT